jgi:hypothetical protein
MIDMTSFLNLDFIKLAQISHIYYHLQNNIPIHFL